MKIAVIGRGNVGGGLARLWRSAGHEVEEFGREGGEATDADVALLAVPSSAIGDALAAVSLGEGTPLIDATNAFRGRAEGFESLAAEVKSVTGGPVAKAFNSTFATLYDRLGSLERKPSMVYAADEDARAVTEQLIRDAGYEPVSAGDLGAARNLEAFAETVVAVARAGAGQVLYRVAPPDAL